MKELVDSEEIYKRLNEIREAIQYLRGIKFEDMDNKEKFLLSRYHLQIILEAMFTIGNQVIANKSLRKPASYKDILTVLYENKILERQLYDELSRFAGLRSRLVHTYWKISKEELMRIIEKDLVYFEEFVKAILGCI